MESRQDTASRDKPGEHIMWWRSAMPIPKKRKQYFRLRRFTKSLKRRDLTIEKDPHLFIPSSAVTKSG